MYRINSVVVASTGGLYAATGTITVAKSAGGTALAIINAGFTKSRMAIYQVPAGKVVYITNLSIGAHSATKGVRFILRSTYDRDNAAQLSFFVPDFELTLSNGAVDKAFEIPLYMPAGTRIKMSGIADAAGAYVSCAIRGWI
jgi:hypothetical protein